MHSYHSNIVTLHAAVFAQREAPARNVAALPSGQGVAFHPSVCLSVCLSVPYLQFIRNHNSAETADLLET